MSCMLSNYTQYRDKFEKETGRWKVHTTFECLRILFSIANKLEILEEFRRMFDTITKKLTEDSKSELGDAATLENSIMNYIYEVGSEQNADVSVKLVYTESDIRRLNIKKDGLFTMLMECERRLLALDHVSDVMCLNKEDVINNEAMKGKPSSSSQPVQESTPNIASLDDLVDKKPLNDEGTVWSPLHPLSKLRDLTQKSTH